MWREIVTNKIVISCFLAVLLAQAYKAIDAYRKNRRFHIKYLFMDGRMPSGHTAIVTALSASIFLEEGVTTLWIASTVFAVVTIKTVLGDKTFALEQERTINKIVGDISAGNIELIEWAYMTGHTVKEVWAGLLLGIAVSVVIYFV